MTEKRVRKNIDSIKKATFITIFSFMLLYIFHVCIEAAFLRIVPHKCVTGVIVSSRQWHSHKWNRQWKYQFCINDETYFGFMAKSDCDSCSQGDSISVVYWPVWPKVNLSRSRVGCDCEVK